MPIFINASNNHILIVGGGKIAAENLNDILQNVTDSNITLIFPSISDDLRFLLNENQSVTFIKRDYKTEDFSEPDLVIVATENSTADQAIVTILKTNKTLYFLPNQPLESTFFLTNVADHETSENNYLPLINGEKKWRNIATVFFLAFVLLLIGNILSFYIGFNVL